MLSQPTSPSAFVRPVGLICIVAALMLAGCARERAPQTYGWQASATSIKDTWAPEVKKGSWAPVVKPVARKPAPAAKTVLAPERPATPEPPRKSTNLDTPRAPVAPRAPVTDLDCGSDAACVSQLKMLIDDPQRAWINQSPTPAEYVQGIRLFAYRALKNKLICGELKSALAEIESASNALDSPVPGVTPAQIARARSLGAQVKAELQVEQSRRCTS
jgi:hypothetical protein